MNDRFKFRVWLEYAKLYYGLDSFYYDRLKNRYTLHFEDGHTKTIKEKDCVIEQCTGLKDKNGKLIYEGDIVKGSNGSINGQEWEFTHVVKWNDKSHRLVLPDFEPDEDWSHYYNVIGNIHENPELLKESK